VCLVAKCGRHNSRNECDYTHTSREYISIRYDDTFYEECVSVILYGILCSAF
jgi:hypothetical protein